MTVAQAKEILKEPRFGDSRCIEAVQRLKDETEERRLRLLVTGKTLQCIMCSYRGDKDCPICKGAGEHAIPKERELYP